MKLTEVKALVDLFDIDDIPSFINYVYILDETYLKLVDERKKKEERNKEDKRNNFSNKKGTGKR